MADHFQEPRLGHGLAHDAFKAILAPRPIGRCGCRGDDAEVGGMFEMVRPPLPASSAPAAA